jgi:hypothetical protein
MSEWLVFWQIFGIICAAAVGIIGAWKVFHELERIREQRRKEQSDTATAAKLKRTEFFLSQHRRLFDDSKLYSVLCYLDSDDWHLAEKEMWDSNRKFLTFIEEIALLVRAGQIDADVAQYMFGYYACCAREGINFNVGINSREAYWRLFNEFCDQHEKFQERMEGDKSYLPSL